MDQPALTPFEIAQDPVVPACSACAAIVAVRAGRHPGFVAELHTAVLLMHPDQRHPGHVLVMAKAHVADLLGLPADEREPHLADLALAMQAVQAAVGARKVNVAAGLDGLEGGHLLWHVVPRTAADPGAGLPFWQAAGVDEAPEPAALKRAILRGLLAASPVRRQAAPPRAGPSR
jgi:diadenosine tetraphosphate (Ap4A) HIT family hydrolase